MRLLFFVPTRDLVYYASRLRFILHAPSQHECQPGLDNEEKRHKGLLAKPSLPFSYIELYIRYLKPTVFQSVTSS